MELSLLGGALGGVMRVVPEVFKYFGQKREMEHEYQMSKLQLDIDAARSKQQIDMVHATSEATEAATQAQTFLEAIKSQGQLTGVKWVDGVNATVRPFLTYWWMILFTSHKVFLLSAAWGTEKFVDILWTTNDYLTLSMILSFWFVDRAFRKNAGK